MTQSQTTAGTPVCSRLQVTPSLSTRAEAASVGSNLKQEALGPRALGGTLVLWLLPVVHFSNPPKAIPLVYVELPRWQLLSVLDPNPQVSPMKDLSNRHHHHLRLPHYSTMFSFQNNITPSHHC